MATFYVSSVDGSDASDGATWTNAKATVAGALLVATADGDIIYVDSAHAFTAGAAITWNAPTAGTGIRIISADRASGEPPTAWLAGAAESVGAASAAFTIATTAQSLFIYGMTLTGGTNNSSSCDFVIASVASAVAVRVEMKSCVLSNPTAAATGTYLFGAAGGSTAKTTHVHLVDTTVTLHQNAAIPVVLLNVVMECTNITIAFAGATKPTTLFAVASSARTDLTISDSDLSGYNTTSGFYFDVSSWFAGEFILTNCKLSSTPALVTGTWASNAPSIMLINTDSGDSHNVFEFRNRLGTLLENTTNYANNGAQFDGAGISWEIVTTALCNESEQFITPWIHRWLDTTGSQDLHLQLLRDSATDYTNREVWGEFECLESASFPIGTLTSTRNAQPFDGTPADLTNSAKTWTETLTNDNEMEVRVTRTVAEKCLARARLIVGKASTTLYLDPSLWIGT